MKDKIENAGSVDEMFQALGEICSQSKATAVDVKDAMLVGAVQTFLQVLPRFLGLSDEDRKEFVGALSAYHSPTVDPLTRNSAFYALYEYLLGEPGEKEPEGKNITRCEEANTPCEDCEAKPTHRIKFVDQNRTEEHFLCPECEKSARKN